MFETHCMSCPCTELLLFNYANINSISQYRAPLNISTQTPVLHIIFSTPYLYVSEHMAFESCSSGQHFHQINSSSWTRITTQKPNVEKKKTHTNTFFCWQYQSICAPS